MSAMTKNGTKKRADEVMFRLIYLATLPAFAVAVAGIRLVGASGRERSQSILDEARAAARTCGSFALMG